MTPDNGSLFSKYKKKNSSGEGAAPAPAAQAVPAAAPPPVYPVPQAAPQESPRIAALEAAVEALRKELSEVRTGTAAPPVVRLALPPELAERLTRSEAAVVELKRELAAQREQLRSYLESCVSKEAAKAGEARLAGLEADLSALAGSVAADNAMAVRVERSEAAFLELKRELAAQRGALRDYLERSVPKDALAAVEGRISGLEISVAELSGDAGAESALTLRLEKNETAISELDRKLASACAGIERKLAALPDGEKLAGLRAEFGSVLADFENMRKSVAAYAEEFSGIERECRKALGDVQGYARSVAQRTVETGFESYLKDSVARLASKLAEVETSLRGALADVSGRLASGEALSKMLIASAEENLRKAVDPATKALESQIAGLREKVVWLTDEYKIVMERKIRALEGQKGAFEAISRRMDSIGQELQKNRSR